MTELCKSCSGWNDYLGKCDASFWCPDKKEINLRYYERERDAYERKRETLENEISDFYEAYWPEDPRKLLKQKIEVPLPYLSTWLSTYGRNNWRRMHGLPVLRGRIKAWHPCR